MYRVFKIELDIDVVNIWNFIFGVVLFVIEMLFGSFLGEERRVG